MNRETGTISKLDFVILNLELTISMLLKTIVEDKGCTKKGNGI